MKYVVEVENLTKEFNGRRVLHGLTFHVKSGEVFGLLGPNGAGKTTTIRIILGLLRPTSGKALVFGQQLAKRRDLRRKIGVVLESDGLFRRLSAYENLEFYAKIYGLNNNIERDKKVREALELVGLYEVRNMKVGYFSKGMRRRLALARALIHNPEVLFLDEPTLGLDVESQTMVQDLITKLSRKENVTILYTSHNMYEVEKICTKVAVLVKGKIIALDRVDTLLAKNSKCVVEICFPSANEALNAYEYLRKLGYVVNWKTKEEKCIVVFSEPSKLIKELTRVDIRVEEVKKLRRTLEETYLELVRRCS